MSLTLDPTLLTAQDNLVRRPIIELVSTQPVAAIPFDGEYFNTSDIPEGHSSLIFHSSGRIVSVFIRDSDEIIVLCTDIDRVQWKETSVFSSIVHSRKSLSLCELSNGDIGIVYVEKYSPSTYYLKYMVVCIDDDDNNVSQIVASTLIGTYTSPDVIGAPFVYQLQDDSFLLVYSYYDGTDYLIYKRTSADFFSWSAHSSITLSGFDTTYNTNNPSLIQVSSGDILLFLDHVTNKAGDSIVTNIFKLLSDDNGSTWDVPEQLTFYTVWGSGGIRPYPALTSGNIIKLSFHETNSVLFMNYDSDLWQSDCVAPEKGAGSSIHYDSVTKKLYVKQIRYGAGNRNLCGVTVIDTENWVVERNYNKGTVPDYSDLFFDTHVWYGAQKHHSEGKYIAVSTMDHENMATMVINDEAETITTYVFKSNDVYDDIVENLDGWLEEDSPEMWIDYCKIFGTWVDADSDRVYIGIAWTYTYQPYIQIGYIDLTEVKDPITGMYTFHKIDWITDWNEIEVTSLFNSNGGLMIIKELNYFCLYGITAIDYWQGRFGIYDISTGYEIKTFNQTKMPSFPCQGIGHCTYYNNHIYGMITYTTRNDQEIYRGLCDINLSTWVISYHRPSYASVDQYDLLDGAIMDEDRIAFAAWGYGVTVYDIVAESWLLYNNDNVSGFEPIGAYNCVSVAYNAVDDIIYVGSSYIVPYDGWSGIRAIPEVGSFNQGQYMVGTLDVDWGFSEALDLSQGLSDLNFAIAIDNEDILWALWTRKDLALYSIKWDKDQAELNLTPYLIGSVTVSWDIVNSDQLTFNLSYGHLFDINNSLSALNIYSKKGRMITLRFGEKIDEIEYWQNQGTFYIKSTKVSYGNLKYPSISISCEDKTSMFDNVEVVVSDYYSDQYPEALIRDLVTTFTGLETGDISIDDFSTRHKVWHQIINQNLKDSIIEILDHFQYFLRMDVDNKLVTRKIRPVVDSIDHEYVNTDAIIDFTPNDDYSSFTNRVIVKGELRDPLEVLYAEEMVASLSGTGGWWDTDIITERVYFSEDHERKCRNVRLVAVKSIKDFEILWIKSGGNEEVSYYDPNELFVEIEIEFPGLQSVLISLLAAELALGVAAVKCVPPLDPCGPYIMAFTILTNAVGYVLGQVATYEYELYGRPIGEVKQTVQAIANDDDFQAYLEMVITESIDDELCYDLTSCQTVADFELEIVKAQRKRNSFSKVAHLQDETGDIIKIYHPYSKLDLNIFITSLKRTFSFGESGQFVDLIEGWNI